MHGKALNVNLKDLYEGLDVPQEEISAIGEKTTDDAEMFSYDEKSKSIILTKNARRKNMLPQLLLLEPGGKTHLEQNPSGTEKFVFCTEGRIQINIDNKKYDLKKGTSLYFNSNLSHSFINIGKKTAKWI